MPNYVKNKITIEAANEEEAHKIISSFGEKNAFGENTPFTFHTFVPMPEVVAASDNCRIDEKVALYAYLSNKDTISMDKVERMLDEISYKPNWSAREVFSEAANIFYGLDKEQRNSCYKEGKIIAECQEKYGVTNPINWATDNWDTKWDAIKPNVSITDEGVVVEFLTAWSCPEKVIQAMGNRIPDTLIRCEYADEDYGINCGVIECRNEEFRKTEYTNAEYGMAFALKIWDVSINQFLEDQERNFKDFCKSYSFDSDKFNDALKQFGNELTSNHTDRSLVMN